MTKTLLLLGGSHAEIPLIVAAQSLGFRVVTTGNKPTDAGHSHSDEYRFGDFSNIEKMISLARDLDIDAVCSGCNDFAAISAAGVAENLDLPGHDTLALSRLIHHKSSFYEIADSVGVPVPRSFDVTSLDSAQDVAMKIGFPVIVKPIDLTGGKGVSVANSVKELRQAWSYAQRQTRKDSVVIQKFVVGTNHAISTLIVNRRIQFCIIDNEHYFVNPYLVGAASFPSILSPDIQAAVESSVSDLVSSCPFTDGILHLQFIVNENGDHYFIDVCRRSPGDLYIKFVQEATGVNYPELIVRGEAGLPMQFEEPSTKRNIGRLCLMPTRTGRFESVQDLPGPGKVLSRVQIIQPGSAITDITHQKIEIIQIEFASSDEMLVVMNNPSSRFSIIIS